MVLGDPGERVIRPCTPSGLNPQVENHHITLTSLTASHLPSSFISIPVCLPLHGTVYEDGTSVEQEWLFLLF